MQNLTTLFLGCLLLQYAASGQTTGTVNYDYLGIRFTIPTGWVGQEVQGGYMIGSHTDPGFAFISTLEVQSLEELRLLAEQGMIEDGVYLQPQEQLEQLDANSLGGLFGGILQGSEVKAYLIGVINPYGSSVLVMAATAPDMYTDTHRQLATKLAGSLVFSQAKAAPLEEQWKQRFTNAKLTYMDTYSSSGTGGYQVKKEIHLCEQGYFKFKGSSSISVDTGGAFGNAYGNSGGDGTWEIAASHQGDPLLRLYFHNGEVSEYTLHYQDQKTLLNGERYFVTYANEGAEYAPDCF